MTSAQHFLGIDACRGGWIGVSMTNDFAYTNDIHFWPNAAALFFDLPRWQSALIDMPIGLTDEESGIRACEPLARNMLGAKRSSIFSPPVRAALHAQSYAEACRINAHLCGKKISKQAWNIVPKIREIYAILRQKPELQTRVRESHPELCFCQLNDQKPILPKKKAGAGQQKRLDVLEKYSANAKAFLSTNIAAFPRKIIAIDDIIDAMVLALTAALGTQNGFQVLPENPESDRHGLRMEMVFAAGN